MFLLYKHVYIYILLIVVTTVDGVGEASAVTGKNLMDTQQHVFAAFCL